MRRSAFERLESRVREVIIETADDGKRLDRWIKTAVPGLPVSLLQKYLRLKRVKLNGKPAKADNRVKAGDCVRLFVEDEYFAPRKKPDALLSGFHPHVSVVYEDENILLADKQPGLICHPDENEKVNTLLTHVRAYLYQKGEGSAHGGFMPVLVNRIDRFTGGIVICAKTEEAMRALNEKIRSRELEKRYLCAIEGEMRPAQGRIDNYILKSQGHSRVKALSEDAPGAQRAETLYRTLARENGKSLLECTLITGRTHQIRAQLASAGHPLIGDTQYGKTDGSGEKYQALYSYRLDFRFTSDAGALNALNGKTFRVKTVPFVKRLFPDYRWE